MIPVTVRLPRHRRVHKMCSLKRLKQVVVEQALAHDPMIPSKVSSLSYSYPSQTVKQIVIITAFAMPQGKFEANVS